MLTADMTDLQAAGLRRQMRSDGAWPRLGGLAITGGKGGVGKTSVAVNLAVALARRGARTLLVDFDLGLANADLMLGVEPNATLADCIFGRAKVAEAITPTAYGVDLLAAASGFDELTRLGDDRLRHILLAIGRVASRYDRCLIDTAAGIGSEVLSVLRSASRCLLVVTPDPTSLTDAYALVKLAAAHDVASDMRLCINMAGDLAEATMTASRMRAVAAKFLGRELPLAAWLPRDESAALAVRRRTPFASGAAGAPAGSAIHALAQRLHGEAW